MRSRSVRGSGAPNPSWGAALPCRALISFHPHTTPDPLPPVAGFTTDASRAVELAPPLLAPSVPPALWPAERTLSSAADCTLAQNDPIREAMLEAQSDGWPMAAAVERMVADPASSGTGCEPSRWLERALEWGRAMAAPRTTADRTADDTEDPAADATAHPAAHPAVETLRSTLESRERVLERLVQQRKQAAAAAAESALEQPSAALSLGGYAGECTPGASRAPAPYDGFDVFDL